MSLCITTLMSTSSDLKERCYAIRENYYTNLSNKQIVTEPGTCRQLIKKKTPQATPAICMSFRADAVEKA
jgi:hypothetical protein